AARSWRPGPTPPSGPRGRNAARTTPSHHPALTSGRRCWHDLSTRRCAVQTSGGDPSNARPSESFISAPFFALRIDEAGNAGPLATIGPLTLRRVSLTHGGAGRDRLSLTARITALLAQLGLP